LDCGASLRSAALATTAIATRLPDSLVHWFTGSLVTGYWLLATGYWPLLSQPVHLSLFTTNPRKPFIQRFFTFFTVETP
jgi:hypothetical protein